MSGFRLLKTRSPYPAFDSPADAYLTNRLPVERASYEEAAGAINRALLLPSFRVHRANVNQTGIATGVHTPVEFNSTATASDYEGYDDFGYWDATNHRYLPLVAGVYAFFFSAQLVATAADSSVVGRVWKNGTVIVGNCKGITSTTLSPEVNVACQCRMNGASDYVTFTMYQDSGSAQDLSGLARLTFAGGCKLADY